MIDEALKLTVPPHVVAAFAGLAFSNPDGYESVNATPVTGNGFGFDSRAVSIDELFGRTNCGENAFVTVSGTAIVRVAVVAAAFESVFDDVTAPALIEFV